MTRLCSLRVSTSGKSARCECEVPTLLRGDVHPVASAPALVYLRLPERKAEALAHVPNIDMGQVEVHFLSTRPMRLLAERPSSSATARDIAAGSVGDNCGPSAFFGATPGEQWGKYTVRTYTTKYDRWINRTPQIEPAPGVPAERKRYDRILAKNYADLLGLARYIIRDKSWDKNDGRAEDAVQIAIEYVLEHAGAFGGTDKKFLSHIKSVLRWRIKDAVRDRQVRRLRDKGFYEETTENENGTVNAITITDADTVSGDCARVIEVNPARRAARVVEKITRRLDVRRAVAALPAHQRNAVRLRIAEDQTRQEMGPAWSWWQDAITVLRDRLVDYLADYAPVGYAPAGKGPDREPGEDPLTETDVQTVRPHVEPARR